MDTLGQECLVMLYVREIKPGETKRLLWKSSGIMRWCKATFFLQVVKCMMLEFLVPAQGSLFTSVLTEYVSKTLLHFCQDKAMTISCLLRWHYLSTESVKIDQSEGVKDSRMASAEKDFHGFYSLLSAVSPPFFTCFIFCPCSTIWILGTGCDKLRPSGSKYITSFVWTTEP